MGEPSKYGERKGVLNLEKLHTEGNPQGALQLWSQHGYKEKGDARGLPLLPLLPLTPLNFEVDVSRRCDFSTSTVTLD